MPEAPIVNTDLKPLIASFCADLSLRAAARGNAWFEAKTGPNYVKVLLHRAPAGVRVDDHATFCFISRLDEPFEWANFRIGDILPPKTASSPWKMDTGAVGSLLAPDGGMSYWVIRYGSELGLW